MVANCWVQIFQLVIVPGTGIHVDAQVVYLRCDLAVLNGVFFLFLVS